MLSGSKHDVECSRIVPFCSQTGMKFKARGTGALASTYGCVSLMSTGLAKL